jgi:hypothetical protein
MQPIDCNGVCDLLEENKTKQNSLSSAFFLLYCTVLEEGK